MKQRLLILTAICIGWIAWIWPAGLFAGTTVPDVIKMENQAYAEHTKPIAQFKHKAHSKKFDGKYPAIFANGCGECHHDDDGEPRVDLKVGDDVEKCIECHDKPGEMPKKLKRELRGEGLSREEKKARERQYHAEALHDKCRGCHRRARKEADTRKPPITCSKCHIRDKS